jgi:hypothetical protein
MQDRCYDIPVTGEILELCRIDLSDHAPPGEKINTGLSPAESE